MGAMQAQDFNMAKWAVGIRLPSATRQQIEDALDRGDILRTHVMRPTWHFVAPEDIRWMLRLSAGRVRAANDSFGKSLGITEAAYNRSNALLEKTLAGNRSLTKQELAAVFSKKRLPADAPCLNRFLQRAETEGIVCSGKTKAGKTTYALLEERVPPAREPGREESLARLAAKYFQSHSPASLQDFAWWSGLAARDAAKAVDFIKRDLIADKYKDACLLLHQSLGNTVAAQDDNVHFLPAYDEYLISYKDRSAVLPRSHYSKAFSNNGLFYPVIMHRGKIVGNWKRPSKTQKIETSFFEKIKIPKEKLEEAGRRFWACGNSSLSLSPNPPASEPFNLRGPLKKGNLNRR
jgi:hypothetical protein